MKARDSSGDADGEMLIVDTFTRLIFGEEGRFDAGELSIINALRRVDQGVAADSHREMGQYLRALGVEEMIQLVARVQAYLAATRGAGPKAVGPAQGRYAGSNSFDR